MGLHQRAQQLARLLIGRTARREGLLHVQLHHHPLEPMLYQLHAQAVLVGALHQLMQRAHVQPQLVRLLVPYAEGVAPHHGGLHAHYARLFLGEHRAGGAAAQRFGRHGMARVHLGGQLIARARLRVAGDGLVYHVVMRHADPFGPARAERMAVYEQRRLAAHVQAQDNALAPRRLGQLYRAEHPGILPGSAPLAARRQGAALPRGRLLKRQLLLRHKAAERYLTQRVIHIAHERVFHMPESVPPFRLHSLPPLRRKAAPSMSRRAARPSSSYYHMRAAKYSKIKSRPPAQKSYCAQGSALPCPQPGTGAGCGGLRAPGRLTIFAGCAILSANPCPRRADSGGTI